MSQTEEEVTRRSRYGNRLLLVSQSAGASYFGRSQQLVTGRWRYRHGKDNLRDRRQRKRPPGPSSR